MSLNPVDNYFRLAARCRLTRATTPKRELHKASASAFDHRLAPSGDVELQLMRWSIQPLTRTVETIDISLQALSLEAGSIVCSTFLPTRAFRKRPVSAALPLEARESGPSTLTTALMLTVLGACSFDTEPSERDGGIEPVVDASVAMLPDTGDAMPSATDAGPIAGDSEVDAGMVALDSGASPVDGGPPDASPAIQPFVCPESGLYFCDDFTDGTLDKWDILISEYGLPEPGVFDVFVGANANHMRFTAGTRGDNLNEGELILVKTDALSDATTADYFIEFRVRPRENGNSGQKWLYPMGRYRGPLEWYYGGLNIQNSPASSRLEIGYVDGVSVVREDQGGGPIELGSQEGTDGTWYIVRFDMLGNTFTSYLNGTEVASFTDEANRYPDAGRIGFFTYNRSFEIDYVAVGDPSIRPVQLTVDYADGVWTPETDDPSLNITVVAIRSDGTPDSFGAISSDESVVSVSVSSNTVTLTPIVAGMAVVSIYSGSKPILRRAIQVTVRDD